MTMNSSMIFDILQNSDQIYIGVDEAGRGPLFGHVYTGAAILPPEDTDFDRSCLKDSKKFTSKKKIKEVFEYIKSNTEYYSINYADHEEIDKYNILQATQRSMHRCLHHIITKIITLFSERGAELDTSIFEKIKILVDGNYFNTFKYFYEDKFYIINHECLVKGDALSKEISAASILAKVGRDEYIDEFIAENPEYDEMYNLSKIRDMLQKHMLKVLKTWLFSVPS